MNLRQNLSKFRSLLKFAENGIEIHHFPRRLQHKLAPNLPFQEDVIPEKSTVTYKGGNFDFPCLNKRFVKGPEPSYQKVSYGYDVYHQKKPFNFYYNNGVIPELNIAYETWGKLNKDKSNAVLVFTGLSGSSHAKSHQANPEPGWWEKFIGPGLSLDTDKFFVICANHLGGCYGSTGPSSINPLLNEHYATNFPLVSIKDMIDVQCLLISSMGIEKLHAVVGSSLGGMCSITMSALYPDLMKKCVTISACAESRPTSIALRYLQRRCIMEDENWHKGHYYLHKHPQRGMTLAREIATLTYRSGPEWEKRFGRAKIDNEPPSLCPNFQIEQYIEYQGLSFSKKYDPNSLLYISKGMDLFDLNEYTGNGVGNVKCPVLVMGVTSDMLFPIWQQRDISNQLKQAGNANVTYYEINSIFGHDTFLLDVNSVGTAVKGFLELDLH